jgi:Spy/CpxP family protein refolding chaperone
MRSLLLALTFSGVLAWSQTPADNASLPSNFDALKAVLDLSDDEVTRLRDLRQQESDANRNLCEQMGERQRALRAASEKADPDAVEIGRIVVDMINLKKQMDSANGSAQSRAIALLTEEQRSKLKGIEDAAKLQAAVRQAAALNLVKVQ